MNKSKTENFYDQIIRLEKEIAEESGFKNTRDTIYLEIINNKAPDEASLKEAVIRIYQERAGISD